MNKLINYGRGPREVFAPSETLDFRQKIYQRPRNTQAPAISGSGTVGAAQSRLPGIWLNSTAVVFVWCLNGQEVQQGGSYTPVPADSGKVLTVLEVATNASGLGASARSAGVTIP